MQFSKIALALTAASAVSAQGVTAALPAKGQAPAGCLKSAPSKFEITIVKPQGKRDLQKRAECAGEGTLVISLENGNLKDAKDRTGYIASNDQFQFDGPPQAGAKVTTGFSLCGNQTLALGGTTVFYQCVSLGFMNLYSAPSANMCEPVEIMAIPCGAGAGTAPSPAPSAATPAPAGQSPDGQPTAAPATMVSEFTDGQPQVPTGVPVSEFSDGQPQATAAATPAPIAVGAGAVVGVAQNVLLAVAGLVGVALL